MVRSKTAVVVELAVIVFALTSAHNNDDGCDGEILCVACDTASQQVGGWAQVVPVLRPFCSHCCRVWVRARAESEVSN